MGNYILTLSKEERDRLFSFGEVKTIIKGTTWKDVHDITIKLGE